MKVKFIFLTLLFATALFFSCNKKGESQPAAVESSPPVEVSGNWKIGYILRLNASLMALEIDTDSEADKVIWAVTMTLGERVMVGEKRKATYDGRITDFMKVRRDDGKEGLAFATQVADGGRLAVVVDEKANLYKSPKNIDVTSSILPYKTVFVCFPETESAGFIEIKAYDPKELFVREGFIRTSSISRKDSDIQSSILLQTAEPLESAGSQKIRKDALLESAMLDYPDSVFAAEIRALVNPNAAFIIETRPTSYTVLFVNEDDVNIRDLPDSVAGKVIGKLNEDDYVRVTERTMAEFTVGGQTDYWYHISEPDVGWVFGAFLYESGR